LSLAQAVAAEIAIAAAEKDQLRTQDGAACDPLFRLHSRRWAVGEFDFAALVPVCDSRFRVLRFDYDVSKLAGAATIEDLPPAAPSHPSYVVVFRKQANRNPLIVDAMTARFLELADGGKTVGEILRQSHGEDSISTPVSWARWIENLFRWDLI